MAYLVETSVLVRLANTDDVEYALADYATGQLHERGELLRTTPQNFMEFRSVATRPAAYNGLGFTPAVAEGKAAIFEAAFPLLPDTPDIYPAWKALVQAVGVTGKQVHDARLAAVRFVHGVSHILTFNTRHFAPFASYGPGLVVVSPHMV